MTTPTAFAQASQEGLELDILRPTALETSSRDEALVLHPVDHGLHAWIFVGASSGLELLVWGFPLCYGIFQDWYLTHEFKNASEAAVNSVGTLTLGIQYAEGILVILFARQYARYLRHMMWACLAICVISMFLSSFATEVWQLILLQGIVYSMAGGLLYSPYILWLPEWFVERRSLAGSLTLASMSLGGAIYPVLMNYLLVHTGFRWTLRIWSGILLILGVPSVMGVKPRLPIAPTSNPNRVPFDATFLRSPMFLLMAITVLIQGLGYLCVSLYIPSYATALGFSRTDGTIALSAFNLATVVGQVLAGLYCERRPYTGVIFLSGLSASVLAYGLWGFAHNLSTVFIFSIAFAFTAGAFSSTWMSAATHIAASRPASDVFMSLAVVKGISAVVGPLIAAALHPKKASTAYLTSGRGGWGGYGFTGQYLP
ncbi:MFS general substrate transporter [Clavulina sp. PMI_390]|nr:MFS general substrate transporter [Clavulina sp. PMI_390]